MLDNIISIDETMESYHTPETKKQSEQWIEKGKLGPIKARVHISRTKQMILAVFDRPSVLPHRGQGCSHQRRPHCGGPGVVNEAAEEKKGRPMLAQEWCFYWDNASVHTVAVVQEWLASHNVQEIRRPLYSLDLAPADFFLFQRVELAAGEPHAGPGHD
jgi:hypothetical protein